jgi:hypothetical protein
MTLQMYGYRGHRAGQLKPATAGARVALGPLPPPYALASIAQAAGHKLNAEPDRPPHGSCEKAPKRKKGKKKGLQFY